MTASEAVKVKSYNLFSSVVANFGVFADSVAIGEKDNRFIKGKSKTVFKKILKKIEDVSNAIDDTELDTYEYTIGIDILHNIEVDLFEIHGYLNELKAYDVESNLPVLIRELLVTIVKGTIVAIRKDKAKFEALSDLGEEFVLRGITVSQMNSRYRLIQSAYKY